MFIRIVYEHQKSEGDNMTTTSNEVSCCVLQTRIIGHTDPDFGEFSNVTVWDNEEQAQAEAFAFLSQFVDCDFLPNASLDDLREFCSENDLADFCISFHILPGGDV